MAICTEKVNDSEPVDALGKVENHQTKNNACFFIAGEQKKMEVPPTRAWKWVGWKQIETRLGLRFFCYCDFYLGDDVSVELDRNFVIANYLDRIRERDLALVNVIALRFQSFGNIRGSYGTEELFVISGFAREAQGDALKGIGERLCRALFGGFFLGEGNAHSFEALHVTGGSFNAKLARQKKVACVTGSYFDQFATIASFSTSSCKIICIAFSSNRFC